MDCETVINFLIVSVLLGLTPGPDNIFVLMQSARFGRKVGVFITCGLCSGLVIHAAAVAVGVASFFQSSTVALMALQLCGALYLGYLSYQAFTAISVMSQDNTVAELTQGQYYWQGVAMNVTNPKVLIFFLAFFPQFVSREQGGVVFQIFVLGGLFIAVSWVIFVGISLLAGGIAQWLRTIPLLSITLNRMAGAVLAVLALNLLITLFLEF